MTRTATNHVADQIVDAYVAMLIHHDYPYIIEDIVGNDGHEVVYELLAVTHTLGLRDGAETVADQDAWWDAMEALLPRIVEALS